MSPECYAGYSVVSGTFITMLPQWYSQVVTIIFIAIDLLLVNSQHCSWLVDVTTFEEPFRQTSVIHDDVELVSLQNFLENQFEVKTMQPLYQEVYKAFPYYIRLQITCGQTISSSKARTVAQQGLSPKVTITYDSNHITGHLSSILYNVEHGALVDLAYLEFGDCDFEMCQPSWIVPLPFLYHTTKMQVKIDLPGHDTIVPDSLVVYLNGYYPDHEQGPIFFRDENSTHMLLRQLQSSHHHYAIQTVTLSTASLLVGGFENSHQMILTEDGFKTILTMEIRLNSQDFVCPYSSAHVKSIATLLDRLLFNTAAGIFEVFASYETLKMVELPTRQLNLPARCYKKMVVVEYAFNSVTHVLAVSTDNQVFDATLMFGEALQFERVHDANGHDPCQLHGGSDCSVVSAGLSGTEDNLYLFLIKSSSNYSVIQMKDSMMTIVPVVESSIDLHGSTNLYLQDASLTTYQSPHLFVWGNVILHSNDLGRSISQLHQYTSTANISLFISSPNTPHFAMLNQLNEIWYGLTGDTVSLVRLRPSAGWSLLHSLPTNEHSYEFWEEASTVSVFYDSETVLQELILFEEDGILHLEPHIVPVGKILQHHMFLTNFEINSIDRSKNMTMFVQSRCPFTEHWFEYHDSASYERLEWFLFNTPHLTWASQVHTANSLKVYQGIVQQMISQNEQDLLQAYSHTDHDPFAKWHRRREDHILYYDYMYRNKLLTSGVHVSATEYEKVYDTGYMLYNQLPRQIYIDLHGIYTFSLILAIDSTELSAFRNLEHLRVSVLLSSYSLLHIHTQKHVSYVNNTVKYEVTLIEQGKLEHQEEPGEHLHPITMLLQVWNSNFKCIDPFHVDDAPQGTYSMSVMLGCPPAVKLVFDVASTLDYLVETRQTPYDCPHPQPEMHCFYYGHTFHPVFKLVDLTTGVANNFSSLYTLTVIGGSENSIDDITIFSEEEIQLYNAQENIGSLIWMPLNEESRGNKSIAVFSSEYNGILWQCQDGSPCANVPTNFPWSPEYFFLIEISNWDVGRESTYCGYKMQFIVKVHGLQISFYRSLRIIALAFLFFIVGSGLYMWCRDDNWKNWKHIKSFAFNKNRIVPVIKESSSSVSDVESATESDSGSSSSERVMEVVEGNPEILRMMTPSGVIRFPNNDDEGTSTGQAMTTKKMNLLFVVQE
ncbi:cation channel sperm-associated protein subunit gamma 1-like isoform X2 [Anneissia japonica]|uniref:cation channel sperm-associated protein subunit gamma 1-like isoform X2 n=1 Tax=Anneissia japonica TaxID=1529436 RepID=UPI001425A3A0|nr:cation channel sperm-associated protein subunit gamma 1-like isoform X2 [Anneissia japonica]